MRKRLTVLFLLHVAAAVSVLVAGIVADRLGVAAVYYLAAILGVIAIVPMLFVKRMSKFKVVEVE